MSQIKGIEVQALANYLSLVILSFVIPFFPSGSMLILPILVCTRRLKTFKNMYTIHMVTLVRYKSISIGGCRCNQASTNWVKSILQMTPAMLCYTAESKLSGRLTYDG